MKILQKLILPFAVLAVIGTIYMLYFSPFKGLGSFNDFDPNSHAQKEIKVKVLIDKGIENLSDRSSVQFYVEDANGKQMIVESGHALPVGFEKSENAIITGHIHGDLFIAAAVSIE